MVVNSDDGFEVTVGMDKCVSLGQFDGGRGASDTLFLFTVTQPGIYCFRLLWFEGGGGANVEWFTVNADGSRALVNGAQTGSLMSYRGISCEEPVCPVTGEDPEFTSITLDGANVTMEWTGGGTLQEGDSVEGPWTDVAGAVSPYTTVAEGAVKIYRVMK